MYGGGDDIGTPSIKPPLKLLRKYRVGNLGDRVERHIYEAEGVLENVPGPRRCREGFGKYTV